MKKIPSHFSSGLVCVLLFAAMLFSPKAVFQGAEDGLLLWFQIIVPTLFPFMLIASLLLETGGLSIIAQILGRPVGAVFASSRNGSFAILAGFLCGYPMGAKVTADLVRSHQITPRESAYLLSFCNNTSPIFIMNFIVWKMLGNERLMAPTLVILLTVPVLLSFLFRRIYLHGQRRFPESYEQTEGPHDVRQSGTGSQKRLTASSLFDNCMMNGFEAIVKVGGYIIFFSILIALFEAFPGDSALLSALAPSLEMTNGILMLSRTIPDLRICYPLILGLASFGGFCSVAQTKCMIQGTGLSIVPYTIQKLAAALAASFLGFLYIRLF